MQWSGLILFLISLIGAGYLIANMGFWDKSKDSHDDEGSGKEGRDGG